MVSRLIRTRYGRGGDAEVGEARRLSWSSIPRPSARCSKVAGLGSRGTGNAPGTSGAISATNREAARKDGPTRMAAVDATACKGDMLQPQAAPAGRVRRAPAARSARTTTAFQVRAVAGSRPHGSGGRRPLTPWSHGRQWAGAERAEAPRPQAAAGKRTTSTKCNRRATPTRRHSATRADDERRAAMATTADRRASQCARAHQQRNPRRVPAVAMPAARSPAQWPGWVQSSAPRADGRLNRVPRSQRQRWHPRRRHAPPP